jgi:adenine-specific DNA-methyltransferase
MSKKLGQYFTKNKVLLEKLYEFHKNKAEYILEPSVGQGHIVDFFKKRKHLQKFKMVEIDKKLKILPSLVEEPITHGNFLDLIFDDKYKTIIGNPPYVKKKGKNLYIEFIERCYELLDDEGELIFIIPSDFFKLTSASKLIIEMMGHGNFTDIYHPHNENLFEEASVDVLIFRYQKTKNIDLKINYNDEKLNCVMNNGTLTFEKEINENYDKFEDYLNVYVGMVSGNESILKNETYGNIEMINDETNKDKYIFIDNFPTSNINLNNYLLENKEKLCKRKIRKINENNWFEFGLPRNIKMIEKNKNKECLYIHNLSRKTNICFKSKVDYFGGNLLMILPKNENKVDLEKLCTYFNSNEFKEKYIFSNRFKINQKNIKDCYIPNYIF